MNLKLANLDTAQITDVGRKRERNEDACHIVIPPPTAKQYERGAMFLVADGMGGLGGGDVASNTAIQEMVREYYAGDVGGQPIQALLVRAFTVANELLRKRALQIGLPRIGTTLAGLILTPVGQLYVFSVGDSRVYRIREGVIDQLTQDQSVAAQMATDEQTDTQSGGLRRNPNLTEFVGQPTPLEPFMLEDSVQEADTYVVCSDGLWGAAQVTPAEIKATVQTRSARVAARRLIDMANERGAPDNVSVVVVRVPKPSRLLAGRFRIIGLAALVLVLLTLVLVLLVNAGVVTF